MASKTNFRSISLPSRLHPVNESDLRKLDYCSTSEAIRSGLLCLAELYGSLPQNRHQSRESVENSLESSAQLLDSCNAIRELIEMIRENARALESSFRRKGPAVIDDVDSYFRSRKKMSKLASKSLKALKHLESTTNDEVAKATISVLRSGLEFLSLPAGRSVCRWNLVSRLTWTMGRSRLDGAVMSEVGCVDYALSGLRHGELSKGVLVDLQRSLRELECCVEGIEVGLQRLFRQMLQSRVALLNVLTDH